MDCTDPETPTHSYDRAPGGSAVASLRRSRRSPSLLAVQTSQALINAAPVRKMPIDVALYFAGLAEQNETGCCFNAQWPVDLGPNPLLCEFESVVPPNSRLGPRVDLVGWSAAFVNWCLARSGLQGTTSADSQSFRRWISPRAIPAYGDIAVFADVDSQGRQMVSGQVAFWMADFGNTVQIVAANHRHNAPARISQMPVARVRIDPQGRINRILLGVVPIAALQQRVDSLRPAL